MKTLRTFFFIIVFILCAVPSIYGQVILKAELSQFSFLQYEPIRVRITMRNISGHPLAFGENEGLKGTLRFLILSVERGAYVLSRETPSMKGIILQPGSTRIFTYNISSYYDVRRTGNYGFKAVLSHSQLDAEYESNTLQFSVNTGRDIWSTIVGVPKHLMDKKQSKITTRRYRITSGSSGILFYYMLFVEDDQRVYLARRIGMDLGYSLKPQCAVDELSRLHLLIAASPKVFIYYEYDVTGHMGRTEVRIKTDTSPRLVYNKDLGTVVLTGGRKAQSDTDYEDIKDLPFVNSSLEEDQKDVTGGKGILDAKEPDEK